MRGARGDAPRGDARPRRRALRALAIVVALVLACCAADAMLRLSQPSAMGDALGLWAGDALSSSDAEALTEPARAQLPEGFETEVLDLSQAEGLRVAAEGTVVGFLLQGDASKAFSQMSEQLTSRGWSSVASGRPNCGSFVKSGGDYTWLFVSCTQVGDAVSAVVQCPIGGKP